MVIWFFLNAFEFRGFLANIPVSIDQDYNIIGIHMLLTFTAMLFGTLINIVFQPT